MIRSVRFAYSVIFFEQKFKERWYLGSYNPNEPSVFVGCYNGNDLQAIRSHKHKKIVFILGGDLPYFARLMDDKNITFASDKQHILNVYRQYQVKYFEGIIPLKDFSNFRPAPKGDKIYCYVNRGTDSHLKKHGLGFLSKSIEYFGKDKFIFGVHGKTEAGVIADYYNRSFVNLQFNPLAGFTSSIELACMGRKTISNTIAPFAIPYLNHKDVIAAIKTEMESPAHENLIGDYLHNENDWLND